MADRLEAQCGRSTDLELGVDLGGELPGGLAVGADAWPAAPAVFVVAEVPDLAAEIRLNLADAERRRLLGHGILRESSRHKTPQKRHKRGDSEDVSERQRPMCQALMTHRPAGKRRGRDSNPR